MSGANAGPGRPRRDRRKETGAAAEQAAADYLAGAGYDILHRNWRCRTGELDLIARRGSTLAIVEVRSRRAGSRFGAAAEAITPRKCRQVRETAAVFLRQAPHWSALAVRFDAAAVTIGPDGAVADVNYIENAF